MKTAPPSAKAMYLSGISTATDTLSARLTRAQAAHRIGASVATVRRLEGDQRHPQVGADGTHWFDPKEVVAVAASRANAAVGRGKIRNARPAAEPRTPGEVAALVFERFEQRQSHTGVVIGYASNPKQCALCSTSGASLTESQLRKRAPNVPLEQDIPRVGVGELTQRLATLPGGEGGVVREVGEKTRHGLARTSSGYAAQLKES